MSFKSFGKLYRQCNFLCFGVDHPLFAMLCRETDELMLWFTGEYRQGMATFTLDLHLAIYKKAFEKQFMAMRTAIFAIETHAFMVPGIQAFAKNFIHRAKYRLEQPIT